MRVTWIQPEDLAGHELRQAREEGKDVDSIERRWADAGGRPAPTRGASQEEVPLALGLLLATGGDYTETMLGGVNYGRDSDSIASMGGALAGALGSPVPSELVEQIGAASRMDLEEPGRTMAEVAVEIFARDRERSDARARAMAELAGIAV